MKNGMFHLTTKIISLFFHNDIDTELFESEYRSHMEDFVSKTIL